MTEPNLLPPVDADPASQAFFEAARAGRLLVQRCTSCGTTQLGSEICNHCHGPQLEWLHASGRAVVHSFVVMHLAYHPAFKPPYLSAVVELEEGPRLPVYVIDGMLPHIGQAVVIGFAPAQDGALVPVLKAV